MRSRLLLALLISFGSVTTLNAMTACGIDSTDVITAGPIPDAAADTQADTTAADGAPPSDGGVDSPTSNDPEGGSADAEAGIPPLGTLLESCVDCRIYGMMPDGTVFSWRPSPQDGAPDEGILTGGMQTEAPASVSLVGNVALWKAPTGALFRWSKSDVVFDRIDFADPTSPIVVSADGSLAAYLTPNNTSTGATLKVTGVAPGSSAPQTVLTSALCPPANYRFTADHSLIVERCDESDAGNGRVLSVFGGANWTKRDLVTHLKPNGWKLDASDAWLVAGTDATFHPDFALQVVRVSDGSSHSINSTDPHWTSAFFEGTDFYYQVTSPAPAIARLSPDTHAVTTLTTIGDCTDDLLPRLAPNHRTLYCGTELLELDTGAVTPWNATLPDGGQYAFAGFTGDSAYVVYQASGGGIQRFMTVPIAGSTAPVVVDGPAYWMPLNGPSLLAYDSVARTLSFVDPTGAVPPHAIATRVAPLGLNAWALSSDRTQLVYSTDVGLYVVPVQ